MSASYMTRRHALAAVAGTALLPLSRPAIAQTPPATIRVGNVASDTYAEPFYFGEAGMAAKYGITLEVTPFRSGAAMGAALAGGTLDVGVGDLLVIANAINRGIPFTVIAGAGLYSPEVPNLFVCVGKDAPYKTAKDLNGQSIGVPTLQSSIAFTSTKAWLEQNGADLEGIKFVEMAFPLMAPALERGSVAAATITEPFLSQLPADIRLLGNPYEAVAKHFLISEWFTTRDYIAKNTELVRRLVHAVYDTARWANTHQTQSGELLAKGANLDPSRVRAMKRTIYATSLDTSLITPVLAVALKYKSLERPVALSDLVANL